MVEILASKPSQAIFQMFYQKPNIFFFYRPTTITAIIKSTQWSTLFNEFNVMIYVVVVVVFYSYIKYMNTFICILIWKLQSKKKTSKNCKILWRFGWVLNGCWIGKRRYMSLCNIYILVVYLCGIIWRNIERFFGLNG
jgi:hypothetical protein